MHLEAKQQNSSSDILRKQEVPVSEIGISGFDRVFGSSMETTAAEPKDQISPMVRYLENPGHIFDRKVRRHALKYVYLIIVSPNNRSVALEMLGFGSL